MDNIQVELVNKEECKEFFKKWGVFSSECYATPEGREEIVGKHCYKTGHYSGSRSFSFVFKVKGVSRSCTAQMNRSSVGVTINEKSMRYVDFSNAVIKIPPTIEGNEKAKEIFLDATKYVLDTYKELQNILAEDGIVGEKSNQDCRYILPLGTETSAVYGYTLEALENFMNNRLCSRSQWEIRKVAALMRDEVLDVLPELKDKLVPRCEKLMWCPEGKGCCGRKPTKEQLKNKLNNQ